jgi:hypothetical protein
MISLIKNMEQRKNQFLWFSVVLLCIGFVQYLRKITCGYKLTKVGKILYLSTMIIFSVGFMIVMYFSGLSNFLSFMLGLVVTTLSENIAKTLLVIGENFSKITAKLIKKYTGVDLTKELCEDDNKENNNNKKPKKK